MKIYCMSDIHGCMAEFEDALSLVRDHLDESDTMLCLLGDYIHGGADGYAVLDKIMNLQREYGPDKVVALMGNHEEFVLLGDSSITRLIGVFDDDADDAQEHDDDRYISWIENLPRYFTEGNTIFIMMVNRTITLMERCWTAALSQSFWSIQTRTNITKSQSQANGLCIHLFTDSLS